MVGLGAAMTPACLLTFWLLLVLPMQQADGEKQRSGTILFNVHLGLTGDTFQLSIQCPIIHIGMYGVVFKSRLGEWL